MSGKIFWFSKVGRVPTQLFLVIALPFILQPHGALAQAPSQTQVGYAVLRPDGGQSAPAGTVVFSFTQNDILVTEAGVPSARPTTSARIFADVNPPRINTGIAIANPNDRPANVRVDLVTADGSRMIASANLPSIPVRGQVAKFIHEMFQTVPVPFQGVLNIVSDVPVAVVTLRLSTNERGETLFSTLPVADLQVPTTTEPVYLPQVGDGGGLTTQFILINPTSGRIRGTLALFAQDGRPLSVTMNSLTRSAFPYDIPANGVWFPETGGLGGLKVGSVTIQPDSGSPAPVATALFRLRGSGVLVTEAGVGASPLTKSARIFVDVTYLEANGTFNKNTGVAIDNPFNIRIFLNLKLRALDRTGADLEASLEIPPAGQMARSINELFPDLPVPFQGVLDITSNTDFAAITLRQTTNQRGDTLLTTLPVADLTRPITATSLIFPQIGIGEELSTELILINTDNAKTARGTLNFYQPNGSSMTVPLRGEKGSQFSYTINPGRGRKLRAEIPFTGVTDESGKVVLSVAGQDVPFKFIDKTTGNPIPGLSLGVALDPITKAQGVLMAVDPSKQYPLRIVILQGETETPAGMKQDILEKSRGFGEHIADQVADQVVIALGREPNTTLERVVFRYLPRATEYVGLADLPVLVFKMLDSLGVPLGEYAGKSSHCKREELTPDEAWAEIKRDLELNIVSKLFLFPARSRTFNPVNPVAVVLDLLTFAVDASTTFNCGLPGQKIIKTSCINDIFTFLDCKDVPVDLTELVRIEGCDEQCRQRARIDSTELVSKTRIGLGFKTPADPSGTVTINVPKGEYRAIVRSPDFCPKTVDLSVPEGGTSLNVNFAPCRVATLTLSADRLTGFLAPGTDVKFTAVAKDAQGNVVPCDAEFMVTNPVGSTVATIDPRSGWLTVRLDDGAAKVTARCEGVTSNAILVSGTGEGGPEPPQTHRLTVTKAGNGSGTVTSSDGRINCGSICSVLYPAGTTVTLTARADSGSRFEGWSGACTGTGPCRVTLDVSPGKAVTATFNTTTGGTCISTRNCIVRISGGCDCAGTVNGPCNWAGPVAGEGQACLPGVPCRQGLSCNNGRCEGPQGRCPYTSCTYSISPTGLRFESGGGSGTVAVTAPSGCAWTATSNDSWITITSARSGNGNGTLNYSAATNTSTSQRTGTLTIQGQNFTGTHAVTQAGRSERPPVIDVIPMSVAFGNVTVGSSADRTVAVRNVGGGTLTGSASVSGTGFSVVGTTTFSLAANQSATLTVRFTPVAPGPANGNMRVTSNGGNPTVSLSGTGISERVFTLTVCVEGRGTVTSSPEGIRCPAAACEKEYPEGTTVTLEARADPGWTFVRWKFDCSGTGRCQVKMDANRYVGATFFKPGELPPIPCIGPGRWIW